MGQAANERQHAALPGKADAPAPSKTAGAMIARLRGSLLELDETVAVIDVGGVGYEVEVTTSAAATLSASPQRVEVHTHLVVREDGQALYGFADAAERSLFRSLIKVAGVGPKLALALLSTVSPEQFAGAVASGNVAAITRVPGIGKKTASRLVMELRDRVDALAGTAIDNETSATRDAVRALLSLGYRETDAAKVVADVSEAVGKDAGVEDLVTEALRRIAAAA